MDRTSLENRRGKALAALFLLVGVSVTKIWIAWSRGRHNIVFLIILTLVFVLWAMTTWRRERTGAGDGLRRARRTFKSLKDRAENIRPGGMTNDASYLAALFGLAALPAGYFPFITTLFPKAVATSGDSYTGRMRRTAGGVRAVAAAGGAEGVAAVAAAGDVATLHGKLDQEHRMASNVHKRQIQKQQ